MALIASSGQNLLQRRSPLMLKDYLLTDDFISSCSSNDFRSYPRLQCCTTFRFLLEIDLKKKTQKNRKKQLSTISALQRASEAVINAVKQLHFTSVKSPSSSVQKGLLSRSFSRKLLKRSSRRKVEKEESEIKRLRSFGEFLEEKDVLFDQNNYHCTTTTATESASSSSNALSWDVSVSNSDTESQNASVSNSQTSCLNDDVTQKKVGDRIGVIVGGDSTEISKAWANESEKEQFSPVSVLDCPFQDEDEDIISPFHSSPARVQGSKKQIRLFEKLTRLEPVDLDKRIELILSANKQDELPITPCSIIDKNEDKSQQLLELLKGTTVLNSNADILLLDFFAERFEAENEDEDELLKEAEKWVNEDARDLFQGWEIQENRKVYVRDMEKNGKWRKFEQQKQELAMDLEADIFTSLIDELLFHLTI